MVSGGGALKVGELFASLGLDAKDYNRGLDDAENKARGFGKGALAASTVVAGAVGAIGIAAATSLASAVKVAANFEFAMDAVGAAAQATDAQMAGLNEEALRIGSETAFSAMEAAAAMEILALSGVNVDAIMSGATQAVVDLAAASGADLTTAAGAASKALTIWKVPLSELPDLINRATGAAAAGAFDVADLNLAMGQGGGVAQSAGVEWRDFFTIIAAGSDIFTSGADAGTSFKAFINTLTPTTDNAKAAMRSLGLLTEDGTNLFYDQAGALKTGKEMADLLARGVSGLTEQQRALALEMAFGSDGMRTAIVLSRLGADGFQHFDDVMKNTDAAAAAARRQDNLKGALERLGGAIQTVQIRIGNELEPVLKDLADWFANKIPAAFAWVMANLPLVGAAFAGIATALTILLIPALATLGGIAATALAPLVAAALPFAGVALAMGAVVAGVILLIKNWDEITARFPAIGQVVDTVREPFKKLSGLFMTGFDGGSIAGNFSGIERAAFNMGGGFRDAKDAIGEVAHFFSLGFGGGKIVGEFSETQSKAFEVGHALREGLGAAAGFAGDRLGEMGDFLGGTVWPILEKVGGFVGGALVGAFQALTGFVTGTVLPAFAAFGAWWSGTLLPLLDQAREKFNNDVLPALETLAEAFEAAGRGIEMVFRPVVENVIVVLGYLRDAVVGVFTLIYTVIRDNMDLIVAVIRTVWDTIWSIISLALEGIRDIVSVVLALLRGDWEGAWEGMGTLMSNLVDNWHGILKGALDGIVAMFELIFGLIRSTIEGIINGLGEWIGQKVGEWIAKIGEALNKIPEGAYKVLGMNKDEIVGKFRAPEPEAVVDQLTAVPRGPDVGSIANFGGQPRGPNGELLGSLPGGGGSGNMIVIQEQNIGVRPDIPGGVDPAPIRAALEEIDFSKWDTEAVS